MRHFIRKFIIVFIMLILSATLFAEEWYGINLPEYTRYKIYYFFIVAGHGSVTIEKIDFEGREAVKITGKIWSARFFSLFYKVDDTVVSIIDAKTLEPLWHSVDYHERSFRRKAEYRFDYQRRECTSQEGIVKIKEGILGPLGALLYLRINELKKGIPVKKEVFDGHSVKDVTAVLSEEKVIKTKFGRKNTLVIRPTLKNFRKEGVITGNEKITLYLQKELPRIPYLIEGKRFVASLKAKLVEINHFY